MDIDGFRDYLNKKERSKNTVDTYTTSVRMFFELFTELSEESVLAFKEYLKKSFKPKTVNIRLSGVINYCKWQGIKVDVKGIKIQKALSFENIISPTEFEILLTKLKDDDDTRGYWIFMFLARTGARAGEFVRLSKSGLQHGYDELFTKGKIRRIYFPSNLIMDSRDYFSTVQGEFLFPSRYTAKTGRPMTTRGLSQLIKNYAERYDIRPEVMYPHGFRHLFAKNFLKSGGDLTLLSDLLGHENIGTTAIYTRRSADEMSAELSYRMNSTAESADIPELTPPAYMNLIALQQETIKAQREAIDLAKLALLRT